MCCCARSVWFFSIPCRESSMYAIVVNTIFPIFSIIILGLVLKSRNFIDPPFMKTANQLVYKVAIPAKIFQEIGEISFMANFNLPAVLGTLGAMLGVTALSYLACRIMKVPTGRRGTFIHSSFHGNIAYMAYAVAYFSLGDTHFARMVILSGFVILGQNILAVWIVGAYGALDAEGRHPGTLAGRIAVNPIILSVLLGIAFSLLGTGLPPMVKKALDIVSGMAFPLALLLIGASLSFGAFRAMIKEIVGIGMFKLVAFPVVGYFLMLALQVPEPMILPGLILLAAPPATITYVMAMEMGGHPELAASSISIMTLLSAVSYSFILMAFGA